LTDYRLYWIKDGHFWRRDEIRAENDAFAIEEVLLLRKDGLPAELWTGARKVHHFGPGASAAREG
jgi:hypothetical protein